MNSVTTLAVGRRGDRTDLKKLLLESEFRISIPKEIPKTMWAGTPDDEVPVAAATGPAWKINRQKSRIALALGNGRHKIFGQAI